MSSAKVNAYIGLGSNLGDAQDNVERAILRLQQLPHSRVREQSSLFRTAPIEASGDHFVNAVVKLETKLSAQELLTSLQALEQEFGRERPYVNAPRTLDLDILLFGQQTVFTDVLVVPHPSLTRRAFALIPLLQIDPLIAIPGKGPAHAFVPGIAEQVIQKI